MRTLQSQDHAFNRVKKALCSLFTYSWFCDCRACIGFGAFIMFLNTAGHLLKFTFVVEGGYPADMKQMYMSRLAEYSPSYQMESVTPSQPGVLF